MDDDGARSASVELVTEVQRGEPSDALMALLPRSSGALERYDPTRGVRTIAAAEIAERLFRRAKDPAQLLKAIAVKLSEQRRFIVWWDSQERRGRPKLTQISVNLNAFGLEDSVVSRWRAKLKRDDTFQATLARLQARAIKQVE